MSTGAARLTKRHVMKGAVLEVVIEQKKADLEAARDRTCLSIARAIAYERMKEETTRLKPSAPGCPQTATYRAALVAKRSAPAPRTFRKQAVRRQCSSCR